MQDSNSDSSGSAVVVSVIFGLGIGLLIHFGFPKSDTNQDKLLVVYETKITQLERENEALKAQIQGLKDGVRYGR